jgi:hypothetical protein
VEHAHPVGCDIGGVDWKRFRAEQSVHAENVSRRTGKKALTPEEQEKQKQLDDAYRAATNKIPNQAANDPWASVRPAPAAPAAKKKPQ